MELVYLWVEEYKNIHKQGFNFSPKFNCNYNPDTNELTIDENDDYIENFFGDNINMTAIVGKNGSGKSSVLEILNLLDISPNYKYIFIKNNTFYIGFGECKIILNMEHKYNFERLYHIEQNIDEKNSVSSALLHCNDSEPKKCKTLTIAEVLEYDSKSFDFIKEDFTFKYWRIEINQTLPELNIGLENLDKKYAFHNQIIEQDAKYLNIFSYVAIKLIQYILAGKSLEQSKYWILLNSLNENFIEDNYLNLVNSIELERFDNSGNYHLILQTLQNYGASVNYIQGFLEAREILNTEIQDFVESGIYKTFYGFSSNNFGHNIIDIDYLTDGNLEFLDLSSGEQQRIENVALFIKHIKSDEHSSLAISLIDEPDTYLHPKWQKGLINDYLKSSVKYKKNIQLILTTHSPFLLSDIPKQNIIFLDTDEEGKCIVVDGLKEKKQTFGANIHTLLSDSFFMEDGLMGEFAKGKIDKAITLLNQEHLSDEELKYCEQIISIIGEPIIKNQLQRMLDSKRLKKIDEIDKLYDEIELIKDRIEIMRKNQ